MFPLPQETAVHMKHRVCVCGAGGASHWEYVLEGKKKSQSLEK